MLGISGKSIPSADNQGRSQKSLSPRLQAQDVSLFRHIASLRGDQSAVTQDIPESAGSGLPDIFLTQFPLQHGRLQHGVTPRWYDMSSHPEWDVIHERIRASAPTDALVAPLIQIIPQAEFAAMRDGVVQRGRALVRFLQDIYSGQWNAVTDGVIPESVVKKALQLQGYAELVGNLPAESITISYGPDVSYHNGYVLEDNIGDLGGRQAVFLLQRALQRTFAGIDVYDHEYLFHTYIENLRAVLSAPYRRMAFWADPAFGPFHAFVADQQQYENADNSFVTGQQPGENRFLVEPEDGLYVVRPDGNRQRVGFLSYDDYDIVLDPDDPLLGQRREELGYEKIHAGIPGIMHLILHKKLLLSHAPGTCLADCKLIYPFVEDLVRYYLHEEPLLKSTKSYALWSGYGMPFLTRADMESMKNGLVLKPVRGESGEGVVVGRFTSLTQWGDALDTAFAAPEEYLLFEYVEPLHIRDYISTHRVLVDIMPDLQVAVYPGVYARGTEAEGLGVIGDHPWLESRGGARNRVLLSVVQGATAAAEHFSFHEMAHSPLLPHQVISRTDIPRHFVTESAI